MSCTGAARGGSGFAEAAAISASIWPSRRSTVATSSRAKARSRTDSICHGRVVVDRLVERPLATQNRADQIERYITGSRYL